MFSLDECSRAGEWRKIGYSEHVQMRPEGGAILWQQRSCFCNAALAQVFHSEPVGITKHSGAAAAWTAARRSCPKWSRCGRQG